MKLKQPTYQIMKTTLSILKNRNNLRHHKKFKKNMMKWALKKFIMMKFRKYLMKIKHIKFKKK